jgi:thiol-disulfide isomerase/thioredoxin
MPRCTLLLRAAALVAVGVLASGCAETVDAGDPIVGNVAEQGYVSGDGTTTIVAQSERQAAPNLTGTTLEGESFALADHLGQVVVLNVWASWCAPCRAEADDMQEVSSEFEARAGQASAGQDSGVQFSAGQASGVQFVGLNTRDSQAAADAFVERFALTYPSVVDTDGALQLLFRETLPPAAIPSTIVIDRQGRVAGRAIGEVDRSRLLGMIEPILAEGS